MYIVANELNSLLGRDQFAKSWFKKATCAARVPWQHTRMVRRDPKSRRVAPCTREGQWSPQVNRCQNVQPGKRELEDMKTTHNSQGLARDQPQLGLPEHSF